jgi:putative endonuclease
MVALMAASPPENAPSPRARRGRAAYRTGLSAEDAAARRYAEIGGEIAGRRVRTPHGEIDLIVRFPGLIVFVEVKSRKNQTIAAHSVTDLQWRRLEAAALHYMMGLEQKPGSDPVFRFDVALAARDGSLEIIENARSFDEW